MKRLLAFTVIFMQCLTVQVWAQEEFVQPPARSVTKFSFVQLTGGIIIVQGLLDKIPDTLNFVLDTGSGGISLDSATVEEFHLKKDKSDKTVRGIAGMKVVDFSYQHSLHLPGLPGLTVDNLDFHINNYDLLTSVYGVKIDGIIGFSFLRRFIVKIDYDHQLIEVLTPGYIKYPRGGYLMHPNFSSLPYHNALIEENNSINGRFILDTGAGLCMLLSQDFVEDSSFVSKKTKLYPTQTEGIGGKKIMNLTVMREMHLGPYKFKKVPTYIFTDDYNVTSYPYLGGLIGNDLLRRFNVILNYPDQAIYIKPNNHFLDFFDYSYTGLGIYEVDGDVKVIDIIPDSPGDKAGFKKDDIIFSIDNNMSKNIQVFKTQLQNAGAKMKIIVLRDNKPVELSLKIKSILKKD
jgi:hypothetical protein